MAGRSVKSAQPSSQKISKSTDSSPPKSPSPTAISPDKLPPLPPSSISSPVPSPARLSPDEHVGGPAPILDDSDDTPTPLAEVPGSFVEYGGQRAVELRSSEIETPSVGPAPDQASVPAARSRASSHTSQQHGSRQPRLSVQVRRSPPGSSPLASQPTLAYSHPQSQVLAHYPFAGPHPASPASQTYASPATYYSPQPGVSHYYAYPHSSGAPATPGRSHRAPYSPQYQQAYPAYNTAAGLPADPSDMPAPDLERQASVGSRVSASADMPAAASPRSPAASVARDVGPDAETMSAAGSSEDPQDLAQRIQSTIANMTNISTALPELQQLFSRWRESHGQSGLREELNRRAESQQADLLKQRDQQIEALTKQLESAKTRHSAETTRLRLTVGNLEDKEKEQAEREKELLSNITSTYREKCEADIAKGAVTLRNAALEDGIKREREAARKAKDEAKGAREDASQARLESEKAKEEAAIEKEAAERLKEEAALEKEEAAKAKEDLVKEKEVMEAEFDEQKKTDEERHEGEMNAMREDYEGRLKHKQDEIETVRTELTEKIDQEKEALRAELTKEREDLEVGLSTKQQGLEDEFSKERDQWHDERTTLEKELQNERDNSAQAREEWQKEKDDMMKKWQDERQGLLADGEGKSQSLTEEHEREKEALQRELESLRKRLEAAEAESKAALESRDEVRLELERQRSKFEETITNLRAVGRNLEKENARLQKMVETFGEATDIKSKGDSF